MEKIILTITITLILAMSVSAWADDLGCFEPSATVSGASVQFPGTATSVTANVIDPNDTTTPTAEPAMAAVGSGATNLWRAADFSVPASPTYGTWIVQYEGTVNSATAWGADTFEVRAQCPVKPTVAGSTIDLTSGDVTVGTLPTIPTDWITAGGVADGTLGTPSETYLAAGTEGAGASTSTLIYTSLSDNTRKYNNMCLWASSNGERSKIIGYGSGTFSIRGYNVAPTDGTALRIYTDGCQ